MPASPGGGVAARKAAERLDRERDRLLLVVGEQRQQRLGEPGEVPLRDDRLVAVGVAAALVDRAEDRGRVVGVEERARAVVDGLAGDRRVVGVHDAVHEADEHPLRDERGLRRDDGLEQRQAAAPRGRAGGAGRSRGRPAGAAGRGRRWRGRTGSCRPAGGCARPARARRPAASSRAAPGRPVATTASERVVGMPRACIASLTTCSRSIGPTAARPSPPRANGVRPGALEVQVAAPAVGSTSSPSSSARPSPSRGDEAAELVAGVRLRDRPRAVAGRRADEQAQAVVAAQPRRGRGRARRPAAR